jgi:hypothetical protein
MFVPLCDIRIVKKSDSVETDAVYTLQLYKLMWRGKAEKVVAEPIRDQTRNPMREVHVYKAGTEAVEAEEERLIKRFGTRIFFMVFPGDTFRATFAKAAAERNPWLERTEARKARQLAIARNAQRGVVIQEAAPVPGA